MSESAREMAARLGRNAPQVLAQIRRIKDHLVSEHELARRVFLGPDGKPSPAASEWLRRLARDNHVESTTFTGDRDAMLIREGGRRLALKILGSVRLDTDRLASLTALEREIE